MSEHARRNLVCSSWHNVPTGFQSWSGMVSGYTTRPFCQQMVGHAGDHQAWIETIENYPQETQVTDGIGGPDTNPNYGKTTTEIMRRPKAELMTWPNKLGIPDWLVRTTEHGIAMMREHGMTDKQILGR